MCCEKDKCTVARACLHAHVKAPICILLAFLSTGGIVVVVYGSNGDVDVDSDSDTTMTVCADEASQRGLQGRRHCITFSPSDRMTVSPVCIHTQRA